MKGKYFDNYENALAEPEKVETLELNYKTGNPGVIDERIKSLINLRNLYIHHCSENELLIPYEVTLLDKLDDIRISELIETNALPTNLFKIKSLKTLSLYSSQPIEIPNEIGDLIDLEHLVIHCIPLEVLNPNIFNLVNLKSIGITSEKLLRIPDMLGQLTKLTRLALHCANLIEIPKSINNLMKLTCIDIYSKEDISIPKDLSNLISVTEFRWGQAQRFPEEILQLQNLKRVTFDVSYFESFPEGLGKLENVEILSLTSSVFDSIPEEISKMKSLVQMDFRSSSFVFIPKSISEMKSLRGIDMKDNKKFSDFNALVEIIKNSSSIEWISIEGTNCDKEHLTKLIEELKGRIDYTSIE